MRKNKLKIFWILSGILISFLFAFYIFQLNWLFSGSYSLEKLMKEAAELSEKNKNLEVKFSQLNSLESVEALAKEFNFAKVEKIYYLKSLEESIATK